MNILPKKKWHVRTKENMARVRRDEAKAADEEKRRLDRAILAENERRMQALRQKADDRLETMFGKADGPQVEDCSVQEDTGHVNFFQDLEREERKNLGTGNKEYEEEKKKEQHEWESKMGIQKMLAEGSNEIDKKHEWYESMPLRTKKDVQPIQYVLPQLAKKAEDERKMEKEERKRKRKKEKKKQRRRSRSSSSSNNSSSDEDDEKRRRKKKKKKRSKRDESEERKQDEAEKHRKLVALRDERMKRERQERLRQDQLLHPERFKPPPESKRKYNSQFNPDLARR